MVSIGRFGNAMDNFISCNVIYIKAIDIKYKSYMASVTANRYVVRYRGECCV
jgi:hypothetical protein